MEDEVSVGPLTAEAAAERQAPATLARRRTSECRLGLLRDLRAKSMSTSSG